MWPNIEKNLCCLYHWGLARPLSALWQLSPSSHHKSDSQAQAWCPVTVHISNLILSLRRGQTCPTVLYTSGDCTGPPRGFCCVIQGHALHGECSSLKHLLQPNAPTSSAFPNTTRRRALCHFQKQPCCHIWMLQTLARDNLPAFADGDRETQEGQITH